MRAQLTILLICLVFAYAEDFSSPKYQAQTSQQKMDQLWKAITANQTPYGWYSLISVGMIFFQSMKPTFDTYSDVLPSGRKKLIHSVGAVAQFELIAEQDTPYTGMFKGVSNALIRVSTAKQASKDKEPYGNFAPGMGIKLLRDKTPSANLVAMYGVDGQDSWNMFEYDWSNHIPDPKDPFLQKLGKKFAEATPYIGRIGLKTWAKYDEKGTILEDAALKMPFKLIFRATPEVKKMFPGDKYTGELHELIKSIKTGTNVFDVLAQAEPESTPVKIATFRTKSEFVTSKFGDKDLFFQHNYLEDDLKLHPNWENLAKVTPGFFGKLREIFHK